MAHYGTICTIVGACRFGREGEGCATAGDLLSPPSLLLLLPPLLLPPLLRLLLPRLPLRRLPWRPLLLRRARSRRRRLLLPLCPLRNPFREHRLADHMLRLLR